ncbi:MAG TPA: deoxynucleoside kinase [Rhodothermales bacterium]
MDLVKGDPLRYIAIEGPIGAGKTTLAHLMAERLKARLVLEEHEQNPFLERFYRDRKRWAFQTQLSFLAARFTQQKVLVERDLFHEVVVADYVFEKDWIFAHLTLDGDELRLYENLFHVMEQSVPTPDLIVYLQSNVDRLTANIDRRGRSYEREMDRQYLLAVSEAYDYFFFRYTRCPVLIVNMARLDFIANPQALDELLRVVTTTRYPGVTYFRGPSD